MEGKRRSGNTWCSSPAKRPTKGLGNWRRAAAAGGAERERERERERTRREGFFLFCSFFLETHAS